jgi:signal transduction histidine kinase
MNEEYRILIIDDEEVVLDSCTEILRGSGYDLATASNGAQGLEKMKDINPDLIFVDLKMPGMSGLEVLGHIQTFDPTIVSVVITGFATIGSAVDAMKLGTHDFLPKPFTPDEFRLITSRALEKRKLILETLALRKEKEMLRANFAAIVSHELKSPLSAVQQNLFVLSSELSDQIDEDKMARLERMKTRIAELLELIRTWLRVISTDIESILNNAVKYSYPGHDVHCGARDQDGELIVSVSDTGIGISDEDLPYIFNDFYSGKHDQQEEKGFGLGLALCSRIIEIHGGLITVDSELGKGSLFQVRLPILPIDSQTNEPLMAGVSSSQLEGEQL